VLRHGLLVRGRLTSPARLQITISAGPAARRTSGLPAVLGRAHPLQRRPGSWVQRVRLTVSGRRALRRARWPVRVMVSVTAPATVPRRVTVLLN